MHLLGVIIYSLSQRNAGSKFKCEKNMQFAFVSERVLDKLHFQSARGRTLQASYMHIAHTYSWATDRNIEIRKHTGHCAVVLVNLNLFAGDFFLRYGFRAAHFFFFRFWETRERRKRKKNILLTINPYNYLQINLIMVCTSEMCNEN